MSNKLLLADDSITIQKVVGIIFANEDYELTVVDNGDAALDKAKQISPDIILVDALMPGKTGYEVCAEVRRDPALKSTPLLLMTGAFEPFDEDKARQSGADDFISKPFESQQLIDRVKKLIELGKERASAVAVQEATVTVAPAIEPVAAAVWAEPAAVSVSSPAAAPSANDLAEAFFAGEEVCAAAPEDVFPLAEEVVEGCPDDDLWGAFEIEEIAEGEPVEFGEVAAETVPLSEFSSDIEIDDTFSFAEEDDAGIVETGPEVFSEEPQAFGTGWEPVGEQTFAFREEPETVDFEQPVGLETVPGFDTPPAPAAQPEVSDFFDETVVPVVAAPTPAPSLQEVDLQFAPEEEYVPVLEAAAPSDAASVAPAAQPADLTEAQLAAVISSVSREIIEKIVWEVVPDLAEMLIKEEIRKIKEGSVR